MKIIKNKKGYNDIWVITGLATIFIFLGVLLPYIKNDLNESYQDVNTDGIISDVGDGVESASSISAFSVLLSILSMFFWTFGTLPFWLDMVFIIFRIIFAVTVARNIWVGGGS